MFTRSLMAMSIALSGCSTYVNVKSQLVKQALRAIDRIEASAIERSRILDEFSRVERSRLDDAFDRDVQQKSNLDANWVIEHRKAYAIGLEGLYVERTTQCEALKNDRDNAASARTALALLERIHNVESGGIFIEKIP